MNGGFDNFLKMRLLMAEVLFRVGTPNKWRNYNDLQRCEGRKQGPDKIVGSTKLPGQCVVVLKPDSRILNAVSLEGWLF
jgi:hypothetical protein